MFSDVAEAKLRPNAIHDDIKEYLENPPLYIYDVWNTLFAIDMFRDQYTQPEVYSVNDTQHEIIKIKAEGSLPVADLSELLHKEFLGAF